MVVMMVEKMAKKMAALYTFISQLVLQVSFTKSMQVCHFFSGPFQDQCPPE